MIVSKNQEEQKIQEAQVASETTGTEATSVTENALIEVFKAIKEILLTLHEDPNDAGSALLFKTVMMDNGQFERIIRTKGNTEFAIGFPAAFIHFVNVRYLVQQQRIGEGRATLRIRFVLNRLNNSDPEYELEGYDIFNRINVAIQDGKSSYDALTERCNLTYFDQPESLDNGLQPFWIDYEIWFKETSAWQYRNYVERYIVVPPFTNHSDQKEECNTDKHADHKDVTYDQTSKINTLDNESNFASEFPFNFSED